MVWRMAKALDELLEEINRRSPNRSKISDGGIGNAAHQTRDSDHNPWVKDGSTGVVTAYDFTNDPEHGFDSSDFADWLRKRARAGQDGGRTKYVISDRRIASGTAKPGYAPWDWRPYDGPNAHLHHVHVSVVSDKKHYDNTSPWGWYEEDDVVDNTDLDKIEARVLKVITTVPVRNLPQPGGEEGAPFKGLDDVAAYADKKLDGLNVQVKAMASAMATLTAAVQAALTNSSEAVSAAFSEGIASLKAELAAIDVQVTLGDRTGGQG